MLNLKKCSPFAISLWLLTSCATSPPDVYAFKPLDERLSVDPASGHTIWSPDPICEEKIQEPSCAYGVSIVTGTEIYIGELPAHQFNKKPWSQLREESVMLPSVESYAPLAAFIINTCKQDNCNDQVDAFKVKLDSLNGIGDVLNPPPMGGAQ